MIHLRSVSRSFSDGGRFLQVLHELDWEIPTATSAAVMGRSGSGKSTLLNLLGGLDRSFTGSIQIFGRDIKAMTDRDLTAFRNQMIGFVFQSFHLIDQLTCEENVLLPTWFSSQTSFGMQRAKELLDRVGLKHKIGQRPFRLSGGEKQRIAIARALVMQPKLLLADEPTGNLDEDTGEEILTLFATLQKEHGLTMILVTHETRTAEIADHVYTLAGGKLHLTPKDGHLASLPGKPTGKSPASSASSTAPAPLAASASPPSPPPSDLAGGRS